MSEEVQEQTPLERPRAVVSFTNCHVEFVNGDVYNSGLGDSEVGELDGDLIKDIQADYIEPLVFGKMIDKALKSYEEAHGPLKEVDQSQVIQSFDDTLRDLKRLLKVASTPAEQIKEHSIKAAMLLMGIMMQRGMLGEENLG